MKIVVISGYFDPINGKGHLDYIKLSKKIAGIDGKLIVIVNNDEQAVLKKGKYFMKCEDRMLIINEFKNVDEVIKSIDTDRSVCNTLKLIHSIYRENEIWFVNGGDSFNNNIPETQICNELNINLLDGLGYKISSSSWLTGLKAIN